MPLLRAVSLAALLAAPFATVSCSDDVPSAPNSVSGTGTGGTAAPAAPVVAASTSTAAESVTVESTMAAETNVDATPPRPRIDLTRHVPSNAVGYFECESIEALEEALLRFDTLTGQSDAVTGGAGLAAATLPLVNVGIDPSRIDRSSPIAIAFAPAPGELFPGVVVIAPARDDGPIVNSVAALTSRGMKARRIENGYVVIEHIALESATTRGESSVTVDLPAGFIRGRFRTETFTPLLAPKLYGFAKAMNESYRVSRPMQSAGALYEFDADRVIETLRGAEEFAFGIELDGDDGTVRVRLVDNEDQPAKSRSPKALEGLAHHVDFQDPLSILTTFDAGTVLPDAITAWTSAAVELGFEDQTKGSGHGHVKLPLDRIGKEVHRMLSSFAPGAAVSLQFEPAKAHVAIYLKAHEAETAREAISLLLSKCDLDEWGFEMSLPIRSLLDRTLVEDYTVRFDTRRLDFDARANMREGFKTFLGDSTLHMKVATADNHVLILLGGDTAAVNARIREFNAVGLANVDVTAAIEDLESADGGAVVRTDFVKFFGQIAGLRQVSKGESIADTYREIAREVGDGSAPFVGWTGTDGNDRVFGARFELGALSRAFDAFKGAGL